MKSPLTARQKQLYARHLLLPEIGTAGQARLCGARFACPDRADPRAARVAGDYLRRAGMTEAPGDQPAPDARSVELPDAEGVARRAGDPALEEAAAALAGAFAAVETLKAVAGTGSPGSLPPELVLSEPEG